MMAEKRMFTQKIIDSDAFLDMPLSTQALYFHLNMRADDDGFVNNPKRIQRTIGASEDDLKLLIAKRFVIAFENGVIVIKHWRMHNTLKKDRYSPTQYQEELAMLEVKPNKAYTEKRIPEPEWNRSGSKLESIWIQTGTNAEPEWNQNGTKTEPQYSIGKYSIDKNSIDIDICASNDAPPPEKKHKKKRFTKPTLEEVRFYCAERGNNVDPQQFMDHYDSNGWKVGKNDMKDWKAAVRTWERNEYESGKNNSESAPEPKLKLGEYI